MSGFLVLYQRHTGDHQVLEFPGDDGHRESLRRRLDLERDWYLQAERHNVEICSLSSDSLDSIRQTHSRYFDGRQVDLLERFFTDRGPVMFMTPCVLPRSWKCRIGWHPCRESVAWDVFRHPKVGDYCHSCRKQLLPPMCVQDGHPRACSVCSRPTFTYAEASRFLGYDLMKAIEEYKQERPWEFEAKSGDSRFVIKPHSL